MIEINLLNEGPKVKTKASGLAIGEGINKFFNFIPLILAIVACLHIYLAAFSVIKGRELDTLSNKWKNSEAQRKNLESLKKEYVLLSEDALATQQLSEQRVTWAEKLNTLSLDLPSGMWFSEISLTPTEFILMGSIVSVQVDEMALINKFIDRLKGSSSFFKGFQTLEVGSLQKRTVGSYNVADFTLVGLFKQK